MTAVGVEDVMVDVLLRALVPIMVEEFSEVRENSERAAESVGGKAEKVETVEVLRVLLLLDDVAF